MYHFNENYCDTGSKSVEQIEKNAHIVNTISVSADGSGVGFRHEFAFIVSKARGRGVLHTVKKQCSNGNEIQQSLATAKQNFELLKQSMHRSSKEVLNAEKRLKDLEYMNSLLDSCFKGWH